ncbi:class I SAM-dependent methyltransferase [bacterium]|nr:MAG: class I SAM-dependent methyltransferase [bacterium]
MAQRDAAACPACCGSSVVARCACGYRYLRCAECGLQFLDEVLGRSQALQLYSDDYFFGGGAGYPNYLCEAGILIDRGRRYAHIAERYAAAGRMLDVGSAAGFTLRAFADEGWSGMGIEPNRTMAAYAKDVLKVEIVVGSLEEFHTHEMFDLVTMLQVLEHVFDLDAALRSAAEATKPGGLWLIEELDGASPMARLFGSLWHGYSPPSVQRIFSPAALGHLAKRHGFERVAAGRPMRWVSWAHATSLLSYKASKGWMNALVGIAARLLPDELTLPYPGWDLQWALYRKVRSTSSARR